MRDIFPHPSLKAGHPDYQPDTRQLNQLINRSNFISNIGTIIHNVLLSVDKDGCEVT